MMMTCHAEKQQPVAMIKERPWQLRRDFFSLAFSAMLVDSGGKKKKTKLMAKKGDWWWNMEEPCTIITLGEPS